MATPPKCLDQFYRIRAKFTRVFRPNRLALVNDKCKQPEEIGPAKPISLVNGIAAKLVALMEPRLPYISSESYIFSNEGFWSHLDLILTWHVRRIFCISTLIYSQGGLRLYALSPPQPVASLIASLYQVFANKDYQKFWTYMTSPLPWKPETPRTRRNHRPDRYSRCFGRPRRRFKLDLVLRRIAN